MTWDEVKKRFDNAVAIGAFAAHEWTSVITLHETPQAALKAIQKRADELGRK